MININITDIYFEKKNTHTIAKLKFNYISQIKAQIIV